MAGTGLRQLGRERPFRAAVAKPHFLARAIRRGDDAGAGQRTDRRNVGLGAQRTANGIPVTCSTGASQCFFYRTGRIAHGAPAVLDVDLNIFGLGVEGLRGYVSTRFRTDFGDDEFWPRVNDNFDLLAGYLELNRRCSGFGSGVIIRLAGSFLRLRRRVADLPNPDVEHEPRGVRWLGFGEGCAGAHQ